MKHYTLNELGRAGVDAAIKANCTDAVIAALDQRGKYAWYEDAELHVDNSGGWFEIGPRYSKTGRPVVIDCPIDWYDATELED